MQNRDVIPSQEGIQNVLIFLDQVFMGYSNRDVRDLNTQARNYLKEVRILDKEDFAYTVYREVEDDFGRKKTIREERAFSKGDKIVFTRNDTGLGVRNGTIDTITDISALKLRKVK